MQNTITGVVTVTEDQMQYAAVFEVYFPSTELINNQNPAILETVTKDADGNDVVTD